MWDTEYLLFKIIFGSFLLLIGFSPIILLYWSGWSDNRAKAWGKKTVEDLGYEYIRHQAAQAHYGMYFKADGKRYYVKYYYSHMIFKITHSWKGPSPTELVVQEP